MCCHVMYTVCIQLQLDYMISLFSQFLKISAYQYSSPIDKNHDSQCQCIKQQKTTFGQWRLIILEVSIALYSLQFEVQLHGQDKPTQWWCPLIFYRRATEEALLKVFDEALQQNEPIDVFFKLVTIYQNSEKYEVSYPLMKMNNILIPLLLACRAVVSNND